MASGIKIHEQDLRDVTKALKQVSTDANQMMRRVVTATAMWGQRKVQDAAPVAFGVLKKSVVYTVQDTTAVIQVNAKYGAAVENGRKPGYVPIKPLADWVKKKGIAKGGKATSVAYAISKSKSRSSTLPKPFFTPALKNIFDYYYKEARRQLNNLEFKD